MAGRNKIAMYVYGREKKGVNSYGYTSKTNV